MSEAEPPLLGRTLVTGVTGFIGRHLASRLVKEGGDVRGIVRIASPSPPDGVTTFSAKSLSDRAALRQGLRGVDTVVHLAARVHVLKDSDATSLAAYRGVNVDGTRILLEEAIRAGARRFLFTSSVRVIGKESRERWNEATVPASDEAYGETKLEAECLIRELADRAGIQAPILRLPLVYGGGMKGNMLRLFRLVDAGIPIPVGSVSNERSMIYVENVVEAILVALTSALAGQEVFFVSDGEDLSTPELIRRIGFALDRSPRLVPAPLFLLRACGRLGDILSQVAPIPVTSAEIEPLTSSLVVDPSKFMRLTGFSPVCSVDEGLARTARWYRAARRSAK